MRLVTVVGSLNRDSKNERLIERLEMQFGDSLEESGAPCAIERIRLLAELPFFDPDLDAAGAPPSVASWRGSIRAADAVVIACPEYGHSLPGVLKNALDWLIPSGEFYEKPVLVTCAVGHPERGWRGLSALTQCLKAIDADLRFCEPTVNGDLSRLIQVLRSV